MCGIAGFYGYDKIDYSTIKKTLNSLIHRGPDYQNFKHISEKISVYLLHTRLQIIDLNSRSNQPYSYKNLTLIFNGEIYNYLELKSDLIKKGYTFETTSDTEVLIKLFYEYGQDAFSKCEGMWSLAIYDKKKEKLFLSRDRFGEKPLFFYKKEGGIYFSSEIKSIFCLANKKFNLNKSKISHNLYYGYKSTFNNDETFFKNIHSVKKGCCYIINLDLSLKIYKYWIPKVKRNENISLNDAKNYALNLIENSLKIRTRADVPIAFSLSGGIDSSFLACLAQKKLNLSVNTFSIIDRDPRYNEKIYIDSTIKHLKNNHKYIYLKKENNFLRNLELLISNYCCPIPTISQYIQRKIVEQVSKEKYKIIISGIGSDELFTGYYQHYLLYFSELGKKKFNLKINNWKKNILPFINNDILKNERAYLGKTISECDIYDFDSQYNKKLKINLKNKIFINKYFENILKNRMANELFHEVVPPILHLDDLNSMSFSVENRSPFLDSKLYEFLYSLPNKFLIGSGYQKILLRLLSKNIITDLVRLNREKKGFNASLENIYDFKNILNKKKLFEIIEYLSEYIDVDFIKNEIKNLNIKNIDNRLSKKIFTLLNIGIFIKKFS